MGQPGATLGRVGRILPGHRLVAQRDDPARPGAGGTGHPDKPAIISYAGGSLARTISYREFGALVDRFAAALLELGVRRRDVVAIHLPNWWMLSPLYLACARIGAVRPPRCRPSRLPGTRPRAGQQPRPRCASWPIATTASITCGGWPMPRRTRWRIGWWCAPVEPSRRTGSSSTSRSSSSTPHGRSATAGRAAGLDADDIAIAAVHLRHPGTPKAAAHSHNTLYAAASRCRTVLGLGQRHGGLGPVRLTHLAGRSSAPT